MSAISSRLTVRFVGHATGLAAICTGLVACAGTASTTAPATLPSAASTATASPKPSAGPTPAPSASTSPPTATPLPAASPTAYAVTETANVAYGTEPAEILDAYVPADGKASRPAVMVVHGGASTGGDKATFSTESLAIAQAGFTVFNLDYTLATPTAPGYPVQGDQVQSAIVWARANAATYGVDPARIGGLGSSHGAELVALVALEGTGSQQTGSRLMAAVTWSAPTDLVALFGTECSDDPTACEMLDEYQYFDCLYSACPATYVAASPVTYVDASDPPFAIFNSTNELVPLPQAQELANDLTADGVFNVLTVYPGTLHAAAYASQALAPSIAFFRTELYR